MENLLTVRVYFSALLKKKSFNGKAISVSSKNSLGDFDILPFHSNFITLIFDELVIKTEKNEDVVYNFSKGVLEVSQNKVDIFLGL